MADKTNDVGSFVPDMFVPYVSQEPNIVEEYIRRNPESGIPTQEQIAKFRKEFELSKYNEDLENFRLAVEDFGKIQSDFYELSIGNTDDKMRIAVMASIRLWMYRFLGGYHNQGTIVKPRIDLDSFISGEKSKGKTDIEILEGLFSQMNESELYPVGISSIINGRNQGLETNGYSNKHILITLSRIQEEYILPSAENLGKRKQELGLDN